jgi:hypothetical protein
MRRTPGGIGALTDLTQIAGRLISSNSSRFAPSNKVRIM